MIQTLPPELKFGHIVLDRVQGQHNLVQGAGHRAMKQVQQPRVPRQRAPHGLLHELRQLIGEPRWPRIQGTNRLREWT